MLENTPRFVGAALQGVRAGMEKILYRSPELAQAPETIKVSSPAFPPGGSLPSRFTADGEGFSPPLEWSGIPPGAASLALIIEDPDAPTPEPLVHCIAFDIPPDLSCLKEQELSGRRDAASVRTGTNSFMQARYLPPDPPTDHGAHAYTFQVFALDRRPDLGASPGRSRLLQALAEATIGRGLLVGYYERP